MNVCVRILFMCANMTHPSVSKSSFQGLLYSPTKPQAPPIMQEQEVASEPKHTKAAVLLEVSSKTPIYTA